MKLKCVSKALLTILCVMNTSLIFTAMQEVPLELTAGQQRALAQKVALGILKKGVEVHAPEHPPKTKKQSPTRSGGYQSVSSVPKSCSLAELLQAQNVTQDQANSAALIATIKETVNGMVRSATPKKGKRRTTTMTFIQLYEQGQTRGQVVEVLESGLEQAAEQAVQDALQQVAEGAPLKQVGVALEESMQEQIITVASLALATALTSVGIPVTPTLLTPLVTMAVEGVYKAGSLILETVEHSTCCITHEKDEKARFAFKEDLAKSGKNASGNYQTFEST